MTITLNGNYSKAAAEQIKEIMQGESFYNFNIEYSNFAGNCNIIVSTNRPKTTKKELTDMFYFMAMNKVAKTV